MYFFPKFWDNMRSQNVKRVPLLKRNNDRATRFLHVFFKYFFFCETERLWPLWTWKNWCSSSIVKIFHQMLPFLSFLWRERKNMREKYGKCHKKRGENVPRTKKGLKNRKKLGNLARKYLLCCPSFLWKKKEKKWQGSSVFQWSKVSPHVTLQTAKRNLLIFCQTSKILQICLYTPTRHSSNKRPSQGL